jgi:O-antigen biosynthesis protein WbqP
MNKIISLVVLFLLFPIFFIVAVLILIEDYFPIFFLQERIGVNNRTFKIIKFRSMKKSAPNIATDLLKNSEDYILNSGKLIRKLSIDELPNLINIVKGEMNFVGPRPALPSQTELNLKREQLGIHKLKPGITGWAQINGRDEISIDKKVELDYYYLQNKSFLLDIKIIFLTFFKVFKKSNISH